MVFKRSTLKLCSMVLILMLCLGLFSACSSKESNDEKDSVTDSSIDEDKTEDTTDEDKSGKDEEINLEFSYFVDADETVDLYNELMDIYQEKNPGIKIDFKPVIEDYENKILVMVAGGNAPDIMWAGPDIVYNYAKSEALLDLTEYDNLYFNSADFIDDVLDSYKVDDKIYALPADVATTVLYINKNMFKEAGIEIPERGFSWDEIREIAKKLTKRDEKGVVDQYGFALIDYRLENIYPMIVENKGEILSDDGAKSTFASEESLEVLKFLHDIWITDKSAPPASGENVIPPSELFTSEKLAMLINGGWFCSLSLGDVDFEWDIVNIPYSDKNEEVYSGSFSGGFGITSSTKYPDEAAQFLGWFAGEEGQKLKFAEPGRFAGSPTIKSLLDTELAYNGFVSPKHPDVNYELLAEYAKSAISPPTELALNNEITEEFETYIELMLLGELTPEEAAKDMDDTITPLLNK